MTQQPGNMPSAPGTQQIQGNTLSSGETRVLQVVEEQLDIRKIAVETGAVRVRKIVHEESRTVDMSLMQEEVSIMRVPVNKVVEDKFQSRQEGDTLSFPSSRKSSPGIWCWSRKCVSRRTAIRKRVRRKSP